MKKNNFSWTILIIFAVILMLIVVSITVLNQTISKQDTKMYFTSNSDLPDYLIQVNKNMIAQEIDVGSQYNVQFTIIPDNTATYVLVVDSVFYKIEKELDLIAGQKKKLSLTVSPTHSDKWQLNSTTVQEWHDEIDVTSDSWLAEKRDFAILMNNNTLPSIVLEDYHLPVSYQVSQLGSIYHVNFNLSDLRHKPFHKTYETTSEESVKRTIQTDVLDMYVRDDVLIFNQKRIIKAQISEEKEFLIQLFRNDEIDIDASTGFRKPVSQLKFSYIIV